MMSSPSASNPSHSSLDEYITASGESTYIDAKGPILWDGGRHSAALAKDIAAFANSRDGGAIVIGKSESPAGGFALVGLSDEEARSFETTKVARWVNTRFSPPIGVVCHHHVYQNMTFVVVTVSEFDDIPILCTKSFQDPANPKKHILRDRTIYVRNSNAESAPLESVEELRRLIGLATSKRANELLSSFQSMLSGQPLVPLPTDGEQFESELISTEQALGLAYSDELRAGAWKLVMHPQKYEAERWPDARDIEEIVKRRSIRLRGEFPPSKTETHMREWGVCNDAYGQTWSLSRSGQFLSVRPYFENDRNYESPWENGSGEPSEPTLGPRQWMNFKPHILSIVEMFMFSARLVEEYEPGEKVQLELLATSLAGRRLVTTDALINVEMSDECRAQNFQFNMALGAEELRAGWEKKCAEAIKQFVDLFPGPRMELRTVVDWIEKFKKRQV